MAYQIDRKRSSRKALRPINVHQNKFPKGYISTIDNSRRPVDSLSDLTNIEVVQDNVLRPRPPLVRYNTQPPYPVIGRGFITENGVRSILWMLNVSSVGKLYKQTDGGTFTLLGGAYDATAWASCVQAEGRCYVFNGVNNLSYVDTSDDTIHTYTSLATPVISAVTYTGTAGSFSHYYRVTAHNSVGESIGSTVFSVGSAKIRENWVLNTDFINVTWGAVAGATSYTVYYGSNTNTQNELYTVSNATTFRDDGSLATNPFKVTPETNSTTGAVFKWMYVDAKNSQVFGISTDDKLYWTDQGSANPGDFSNYTPIDAEGSTTLNYVDGFRNGKGDPLVTVSARGAAGKGKLFHAAMATQTVGDTSFTYADLYEANGQSGTYSARGTIKARDALWYFTGQDVKSTGTSQNIVNILTTNTVSQVIQPDLDLINLQYLYKSVGIEYKDKLYWAVPVGTTENNEIWCLDLTRKNMWILRWPIAAKDMWLYEDSTGATHFCVLVNDVILEFTRAGAVTHQDDDVAWRSRVGFSSLVWDEDGIILGKIRNQYFKLLFPKGTINVNATGLTRKGVSQAVGSDTFTVTTTPTGYDDWIYDTFQYDEDPGEVNTYGKSVAVLRVKPKGLLAQLDWEVVGDTAGTDYILSSVNTRGTALDELILKTNN